MQPGGVITGMGIVSSTGKNIEEFGSSLRAGRPGIGRLSTGEEPALPVDIGAPIPPFSLPLAIQVGTERHGLTEEFARKAVRCAYDAPRGVQVSVLSAIEAWTCARLIDKPIAPGRVGIVIAGSNLNPDYAYGLQSKFRRSPQYVSPKYAFRYLDTDHVGTLSEILAIRGEGFTVGGASASGNVAIIKALQLLQLDLADACLVVGALTDLSPLEWQAFYNVGAMGGKKFAGQPAKACRPFDRDHEGFIYGQASACLVLESSLSAGRRGVPALAELAGGALVLAGNRLADPSVAGEVQAMQQALARAGIGPHQVDYLNAHGTSSPLGDETEIQAVKEVFAGHISRLWINSTKGLTGHCLSAAGVVETIASVIQMREGFVHPNINLENPIDHECRFCGHQAVPASIDTAMNNSFGFGGINTSLIIKKGDERIWKSE